MASFSHSRGAPLRTYPVTMDLSVSTRLVADDLVVEVSGEIDVSSSQRLRERLVELVDDDGERLVVDLDNVEFIDSTGLGVLVGVLKRVRAHDGSLALVCSNEELLRLFDMTGLTKVFTIHPSVAAATGGAPG